MENNQKFLKEEALFISKIKELNKERDYESIAHLKDKIFDNLELYKNTEVISIIITSMFICKYFDEVVSYVYELLKHDIEDYNYSFYLLASLIANNDIYMAKSYLTKSKLLNTEYVKNVIEEDGANYSNIARVTNVDEIPCLLLMNYIKEYDLEGITNEEGFDREKINVYKYYEMIDNIFTFFPDDNKLLNFMTDIGYIMFEKD